MSGEWLAVLLNKQDRRRRQNESAEVLEAAVALFCSRYITRTVPFI